MISQQDAVLHFSRGLNFTCTSCGKCCNNDWDLPVSQAKAESIKSRDLYQEKLKDGYLPLKVNAEGKVILGRSPDGACVFLEGEWCELHSRYGADSKPAACQLFPFNLVQAPDGYHVSISFACPAALAGIGPPIETHREALTQLLGSISDRSPLTELRGPISLSEHCDVTWETYLELEQRLLEHLDDGLSADQFIAWACNILENVHDFGSLQLSEVNFWQDSVLLNPALDLLDFFGRVVVAIIELPEDKDGRPQLTEDLSQNNKVRSTRTGTLLPSFGYYHPASEISRSLFVKFFRSQIIGKRLLSGGTVVARLLAFGTSFALLCYYLESQMREHKTLHFSFEHLEKAFSLVEENILTHSDDLEPYFQKYEEALSSFLKD